MTVINGVFLISLTLIVTKSICYFYKVTVTRKVTFEKCNKLISATCPTLCLRGRSIGAARRKQSGMTLLWYLVSHCKTLRHWQTFWVAANPQNGSNSRWQLCTWLVAYYVPVDCIVLAKAVFFILMNCYCKTALNFGAVSDSFSDELVSFFVEYQFKHRMLWFFKAGFPIIC